MTGLEADARPKWRQSGRSVRALATACLMVAGLLAAALPSAAFGAFGIVPGSFDGGVFTEEGSAFTRAGGHPFSVSAGFNMNTVPSDFSFGPLPDGGELKDVEVELPPGFIGDPNALSKCPEYSDILQEPGETHAVSCPLSSQVGIAEVRVPESGGGAGAINYSGVFNMEPPPGVAAAFGFNVVGVLPVLLTASLRSDGDYGIPIHSNNTSQGRPILGTKVTLWGVPADPAHDAQRCQSLGTSPTCPGAPGDPVLGPNPAGVARQAFISNPTRCTPGGVGLETRLFVTSWAPEAEHDQASFVSHLPPGYPLPPAQWGAPQGPTDCDKVPFDPTVTLQPDSKAPDSPTGLAVELSLPQNRNPDGVAQGNLKRATVTLPEGMTISPSAADGLRACSDGELGLGTNQPAHCPDASKVGSVTVRTPLLDNPIEGGVYIRPQNSDDPTSGEMFRLAIALHSAERGIVVKLPGQVRADLVTGRLQTTFDNNPELPFSSFELRFHGGPRAPLATPPDCGTKTVEASLSSWSGQERQLTDTFTIECPGNASFAPSFDAGLVNATSGAFSPFLLRVKRPDGQQYVNGIDVRMPTGILAKLRGVPLCDSARAAAGTCPNESRIGRATVAAGPGANPFYLSGSVSLTEGYRGAPYGLSVAVRAVAGPFDLGTVVVRQAIFVDPVDAHLLVVSDPLPTIVKGVPVRLRTVAVDIDRAGFTLAPTSCAKKTIGATLYSQQGTVYHTDSRFQAGDCQDLRFAPRLRLGLTGRRQTTEGRHPGLTATLRQARGQANIRGVKVRLPLSLALDPDNAQALCEYEDGLRVRCPRASIIGRARAVSPLLNRPLTGSVYFVKGVRVDKRTGRRIRTLPTLLIPLRGEVPIDLRATSSIDDDRLVSTFSSVPDAPVSRFDLRLNGGRHGILVVTGNRTNVCRRKQVARVQLDAQNGKRAEPLVTMKTPCAKQRSKRTRAGKGR